MPIIVLTTAIRFDFGGMMASIPSASSRLRNPLVSQTLFAKTTEPQCGPHQGGVGLPTFDLFCPRIRMNLTACTLILTHSAWLGVSFMRHWRNNA